MSDEGVNRILVILFVLSIPIYPVAIPLWLIATVCAAIRAADRSWK